MKGGNAIGLALASLLLTTLIYSLQKNSGSDIANSLKLMNDRIKITEPELVLEKTKSVIQRINESAGTNFISIKNDFIDISTIKNENPCLLTNKLIEIIEDNNSCSI
jgi:hypothetical protein